MLTAPKYEEQYQFTKERIVLTSKQIYVPGVRTFGHHKMNKAMHSLGWHYHENSFEISMLAKGTFTFATLDKDYQFSGGDVFISWPNEIHGTNQTPVALGNLYWFQIDVSDTNDFLFLKPKAAEEMIASLNTISHHVVKTDIKQMLPLLEKAFRYSQNPQTAQLAASYLQLFLNLLIIYANEDPTFISADIQAVLDYIHMHIEEEITLEQLAYISCLSISQFKEKFKKQIGSAPRHYINQKKIEHAKMLLDQGLSITETAMLLHFSTSGYFSTVFKKYTLYTPGEYLQKSLQKS